MSEPSISVVGPESVALLTALHTGDSDLSAEVLSELSPDSLAVCAVSYGIALLEAWRKTAILAEADPNDYITAVLARMGREVAT